MKIASQMLLAAAPLAFVLATAALAYSADAHKEQVTTVDTKSHKVVVTSPEESKLDDVAVVTMKVVPKEKWKLTKKFLPKLEITCSDGVTIHKAKQSLKDAKQWGDKAATFLVSFTPDSAGAKQFRAQLEFAVCTEQDCQPKQHELTWTVAVR